jgi:hypothetical protein
VKSTVPDILLNNLPSTIAATRDAKDLLGTRGIS